MDAELEIRRIRWWLGLFIAGLVVSGLTAFPLREEIAWLTEALARGQLAQMARETQLLSWLERVRDALNATGSQYPFLAYGTDWLAFAHLVIAVAFLGPFVDPVRNKWVIAFGLIACAGVVPLALIAGQVRQIPWGWRMIDCSFGLLGAMPLFICWRGIGKLEGRRG